MLCRVRNSSEQQELSVISQIKKLTEIPGDQKTPQLKNPLYRVLKAFISLCQFSGTLSFQIYNFYFKLLPIISSLQAYYTEHTVYSLC